LSAFHSIFRPRIAKVGNCAYLSRNVPTAIACGQTIGLRNVLDRVAFKKGISKIVLRIGLCARKSPG
jgi:hypothetical protein